MTDRHVPTDEAQQELNYWYTEMGYIVHKLGEDAATGNIEQHQIESLRDVLDTFEEIADELKKISEYSNLNY